MKLRMLAALSILIAAVAAAQPAPPPGARLAAYLQLTPDQVAAWKQIRTDTAATLKPLATATHDEQQELKAALQTPSPDPATVGRLAMTLHATREKIRATREESKAKLTAVLTPEQKVKFEAFQAAVQFGRRHR